MTLIYGQAYLFLIDLQTKDFLKDEVFFMRRMYGYRVCTCAAVVLTAALLFTGCGNKAGNAETNGQSSAAAASGQAADTGSAAASSETDAQDQTSAASFAAKDGQETSAAEQASAEDAAEGGSASADGAGTASESESAGGSVESAADMQVYESSIGWKIKYDASCFELKEADGKTEFDFTGDDTVKDSLTISYVEGQMPDEALYTATAELDQEKIERSEGWFPDSSNWSFTRNADPYTGADSIYRNFRGIEHNGGTVIIEIVWDGSADEAKAMYASDKLAELADSFEFTSHRPQEQFAYVPGVYSKSYTEEIEGQKNELTYSIELNADHTGMLHIQDDVPIYWTSMMFYSEDGSNAGEYKIEGETLYYKIGSEWDDFAKIG